MCTTCERRKKDFTGISLRKTGKKKLRPKEVNRIRVSTQQLQTAIFSHPVFFLLSPILMQIAEPLRLALPSKENKAKRTPHTHTHTHTHSTAQSLSCLQRCIRLQLPSRVYASTLVISLRKRAARRTCQRHSNTDEWSSCGTASGPTVLATQPRSRTLR